MLKKMFYAVAVLAFTVTLALPQGKGGGKAAPKKAAKKKKKAKKSKR